MGRRGPGTGLRQAGTGNEARQWLSLFDALGSPQVEPLLPHLSLRAADAAVLGDTGPRAAASLRCILAETSGEECLDAVNGVLAAVYAEMEARLARTVFALSSDGFPDAGDVELMQRWDRPLSIVLRDFSACGLPASKRDVVSSIVEHHVSEVDALRGAARNSTEAPLEWLCTLLEWRRFASLGRALALVLGVSEREHLAVFVRDAA